MLVLATLCLLAGSTLGAVVPGNGGMMMGDNSTVPTTMCCLAPQWEATLVDLNGKDGLYALQYAHDDASMREGYYITKVGPGDDKPLMMVFKDFADKKTYTVNMAPNDPKDYTCTQTANSDHFYHSCAHKEPMVHDLVYIGDATVGPASSGLHYDGWAFKIEKDLEITFSLSRDGCVPLMESVKSQAGSFPAINNMFMFNNFAPTIMHRELLTIPAACVNSGSAVVG